MYVVKDRRCYWIGVADLVLNLLRRWRNLNQLIRARRFGMFCDFSECFD